MIPLILQDINNILGHLVDGGIVNKLISNYIKSKYYMKPPNESRIEGFRLENLFGAWFVIAVGLPISAVIFCWEVSNRIRALKKLRKKRRKKKKKDRRLEPRRFW